LNIRRFNDLAPIRGVNLYDNPGGPDDALAGGVEKLGIAASPPILAPGENNFVVYGIMFVYCHIRQSRASVCFFYQ